MLIETKTSAKSLAKATTSASTCEATESAVEIKQPSELVRKPLQTTKGEMKICKEGLISQVALAYPSGVSRHPTLHKRRLLVADERNHIQAGLRLDDLD